MQDRIPTMPGRVKLTKEGTSSPEYFYMEMADEPAAGNEGTPLDKAHLLTDTTEQLIFGDVEERSVNEALADLGGNRLRFSSSASPSTYTAYPYTSRPWVHLKDYKSFGSSNIAVTKDYIVEISGTNVNVYSRSNPSTLVRTISSGFSTIMSFTFANIYHNVIQLYGSDSNDNHDYSLVDLERGTTGYKRTAGSAYGYVIYVDNDYIYVCQGVTDLYDAFPIRIAQVSRSGYSSSVRKDIGGYSSSDGDHFIAYNNLSFHFVCGYFSKYPSKLIKYNVTANSVTEINLSSSFNMYDSGVILFFDPDTNKLYVSNTDGIYTVNVNSGAVSRVLNTSKYYKGYMGHLDTNLILLVGDGKVGVFNTDTNTETNYWSGSYGNYTTLGPSTKFDRQIKHTIPSNLSFIPTNLPTSGFLYRASNGNLSMRTVFYRSGGYEWRNPFEYNNIGTTEHEGEYYLMSSQYYNGHTATSLSTVTAIVPADQFSDESISYDLWCIKQGLK